MTCFTNAAIYFDELNRPVMSKKEEKHEIFIFYLFKNIIFLDCYDRIFVHLINPLPEKYIGTL